MVIASRRAALTSSGTDLARLNYLETRFFDRVRLCPRCDSHHLNVREICSTCHSAYLTSEGLFHHFRCGYVGIPPEFLPEASGGFRCPKCNKTMHHLGTEYDRLGKAFVCRACAVVSENPALEAICLACGVRTPADDTVSANVFTYLLTSRGAEGVRSARLLDDDERPVLAADAPVFRREMILEFVRHQMQRQQRLEEPFSLLLATWRRAGGAASEERGAWLDRVKTCLRSVDLVGQLGDRLYVVAMPRAKGREAETVRRRIEKDLGPGSPFSLSAVEIKGQKDLAVALAGVVQTQPV
jgi:Thaumarchaeal output domain 1